ncbi:MAG: SDR family oxidoreductase [bacterium]
MSDGAIRVLVTGASGFIGCAVVARAVSDESLLLRAAARHAMSSLPTRAQVVRVGDLDETTDWSRALADVQVVVHAAARVHVMHDTSSDPLAEFRRVNVAGTLRLAREAALAGVRRFVFLSSVKVNGEQTLAGHPFTADETPAPADAYGISKHEAELALRQLADETGMEVVIIRPVLVYGAGVKGNFRSMMRWVEMGLPLPLAAIRNRRSFVSLDNLVDLIITCLRHPAAANQTFLVSDNQDVSTPDLVRRIAKAMNRPARLFPVPVRVLSLVAHLAGKGDIAPRLFGSLQVDIQKTQRVLGWTPPSTLDASLTRATSRSEEYAD